MSLTKQNIETLLGLCQKGNHFAQLEVYNRYQAAMYTVAFRIVKNTAEAEDIMQESFLTAFTKLDMFKGEASFGAWLKKIVVNNSISHYKNSKRYVGLAEGDLKDEAEEDLLHLEEDYTHTKAIHVQKCLDQLHESYRQILTLHLIEGFDYEELCEILNISYANCRTLISRAKESLRKQLMQPV